MDLIHRVSGTREVADRERFAVRVAVAVAALFLYPLALGWGDWDAYRSGWTPVGMGVVLLVVSLLCWARGLQLLPALVGMAMLGYRYWFSTPFRGIVIALGLYGAALIAQWTMR